jgi:hypothetical protein
VGVGSSAPLQATRRVIAASMSSRIALVVTMYLLIIIELT